MLKALQEVILKNYVNNITKLQAKIIYFGQSNLFLLRKRL